MLNHKPISVERARMAYFRANSAVNTATNGIERDLARTEKRKAIKVLEHSQRLDRARKVAVKHAKTRRRVDWNVAVF